MTYHSSMGADLIPGTFPSSVSTAGRSELVPAFNMSPSANLMAAAPVAPPVRPSGNLAPAPTLPAIPACLDATWLAARSYCETYPAGNGPDATANTVCSIGRSQPGWYSQVLSTPACGGGGTVPAQVPPPAYVPPVQTPPVPEPEAKDTAEPNYMLWGGLALLLAVAGGGVYYYSRGKKYAANPKRSSAGVRKLIRQLDAAAKEPDPSPAEINALLRKIRDKTK